VTICSCQALLGIDDPLPWSSAVDLTDGAAPTLDDGAGGAADAPWPDDGSVGNAADVGGGSEPPPALEAGASPGDGAGLGSDAVAGEGAAPADAPEGSDVVGDAVATRGADASGPDGGEHADAAGPDGMAADGWAADAADATSTDAAPGSDAPSPGGDGGPDAAPAPIALVQYASSALAPPQGAPWASVTFPGAQHVGDLIVLAVGWTDSTSVVQSVSDSAHNTYTVATGPARFDPDLSQSIYYASNIAAAAPGTNAIIVTFDGNTMGIDLRAAEYSGVSTTAPLDSTSTGSGTSVTASSGPITVASAPALLFVAGMCSDSFVGTPSPGFALLGLTPDGDIAEDRTVAAVGSYVATESLVSPGVEWILQVATFR
jgi:hypothetical protein